ncbi:MAG: hypothetical protein NTX84_12365 [Nitrospirae bacterium]|nr:hypothetical protein [Nitrospirota bacterium]
MMRRFQPHVPGVQARTLGVAKMKVDHLMRKAAADLYCDWRNVLEL